MVVHLALACRLALFSILFWISAPIPMIAGIAAALIIAALHDLAGIWKSKRQSHFLRREEHLRQDGCTEGEPHRRLLDDPRP